MEAKKKYRSRTDPRQVLEERFLKGNYLQAFRAELEGREADLAAKRKDAVLHLRINRRDLEQLKADAKRCGMKYQTFISEILHRIAQDSQRSYGRGDEEAAAL